ncbi:MAG: hypothetical protein U0Q15_02520 [Kineosporiaceae bacterium]
MGISFDYFAAPSDEAAATAIDRLDGPRGDRLAPPPAPEPARRTWWRRRSSAEATREPVEPAEPGDPLVPFDTVEGFVDPVVQLGTLEELLTGRPFEEILDDDEVLATIAERDGGSLLVLRLRNSIAQALADASDERLAEVLPAWLATEEFGSGFDRADDVAAVAEFLRDLAALARAARADGRRLYCWICV